MAERVKKSVWMETGANIIMIPDSNRTPRNLITEYGRLTVEEIGINIQKFIGQQKRQDQNYVQLFHYLTNSMTESAYLKIVAKSENYMDGETPVGEMLFKLKTQNAVINTRSAYTYLRENLTNLKTYMSTINLDIENFNQYVKVNVDGLKARGEQTDDLIINLLNAYQVASYEEFVRYIKTKQYQYDNG